MTPYGYQAFLWARSQDRLSCKHLPVVNEGRDATTGNRANIFVLVSVKNVFEHGWSFITDSG
jgi:hypothetical protein